MVPEAPLERTEAGLVPGGSEWFVLNARDARWIHREGRGETLPFTGWTSFEAETTSRRWGSTCSCSAGDGPCRVLAIGSREHQTGDWGRYTVDEVALCHGAGVEKETSDPELAYERFPEAEPTPYRDGWLPS